MESQSERQIVVTLCPGHNKPCEYKCDNCGKKICRICLTSSTHEGHEISEIQLVENQEEVYGVNHDVKYNIDLDETPSESVPSYVASFCNQIEDIEDAETKSHGGTGLNNDPPNVSELLKILKTDIENVEMDMKKIVNNGIDKYKHKTMNLISSTEKQINKRIESMDSDVLIDNSNIDQINETKRIEEFILETNIPAVSISYLTSNNSNATKLDEYQETTGRTIFERKRDRGRLQTVYEKESENADNQAKFPETERDKDMTQAVTEEKAENTHDQAKCPETSDKDTPQFVENQIGRVTFQEAKLVITKIKRASKKLQSLSEPSIIKRCKFQDAPRSIVTIYSK